MHETNKQRPNTRLAPEAYIDFPLAIYTASYMVIIYRYPIFYVFLKWQVHGAIAIYMIWNTVCVCVCIYIYIYISLQKLKT